MEDSRLPVNIGVRNFHESVPAFVDTGFDGFLILPDRYLPQLGPPDFVGRCNGGRR
jgi:predicted aspartyl protease